MHYMTQYYAVYILFILAILKFGFHTYV